MHIIPKLFYCLSHRFSSKFINFNISVIRVVWQLQLKYILEGCIYWIFWICAKNSNSNISVILLFSDTFLLAWTAVLYFFFQEKTAAIVGWDVMNYYSDRNFTTVSLTSYNDALHEYFHLIIFPLSRALVKICRC